MAELQTTESISTTAPTQPEVTQQAVDEVALALKAFSEAVPVNTEEEGIENPTETSVAEGAKTLQEPPKEPEKPKESLTEESLSNGFAALRARRERFDKDREEFKAQQEAFKSQQSEIDSKTKSLEEREKAIAERDALFKSNPIKALETGGWTFEQLVDYVNKNGKIPEEIRENALKTEFDKKLAALEERETKREAELKAEREKAQETTAQQQRIELARSFEKRTREEVETIIKNESTKYKFFAKVPRDLTIQDVLSRMVNAKKAGKVLALSDAMLQTEDEARKQAAWFGAVDAAQSSPSQARDVKSSNPDREAQPLSNSELRTSGTVTPKSPDDMTDEERMQEALKLFK